MVMSVFGDPIVIFVVVFILPVVYAISYAVSTAFFSAKKHYNKGLLDSLEKRSEKNGKA